MTQNSTSPSPITHRWRVALIILLVLLLLVGYTWAFHNVYASKVPGANDFFSPWAGTYFYFREGLNPYSDEVGVQIQDAIFGFPDTPGEALGQFVYPFYTVFLMIPFVVLPTYAWAQAVWQVLLQVAIFGGLILTLRYHRWQPPLWLLAFLFVWILVYYPTTRGLLLGQLALPVFTLTVAALWLVRPADSRAVTSWQRDALAGILLALTTVKPQMQFLILPFVMLWALRERRWPIIIAFGATMSVLLGASFILLPSWLADWLGRARVYPEYTPPAVLNILTHELLGLGAIANTVERVLDAGLALYLLYEWWRVLWRREDERTDWLIGLTLVITHLVALRTATPHFVVFVFPLVVLLRDLTRRTAWGQWGAVGLMLLIAVGMWSLFALTVEGNREHNLMHVPLPLLMLALMLIGRPRKAVRRGALAS